MRRQLIRPDRAQLPGDDGFRFRHLLIRDAAYGALPKATRADLHERFADWLDEHGTGLVELDEIVGYHLEQAARFKAELGQPDEQLSLRAAERLARAARRIRRPGNDRTARALFARAVELTRPFAVDVRLEVEYADEVHWEDAAGAVAITSAAAARAAAAGDSLGEALGRIAAGHYAIFAEQTPEVDAVEALALETLPLAEAQDDKAGQIIIWRALGYGIANERNQMELWAQAAERCVALARDAGGPRGDAFGVAAALVWGPRPADEALDTLNALADELGDASYDLKRAYLMAALGRFDDAWAIARPASERLNEFGDARSLEWSFHIAGLQGDYERAADYGQQVLELVVQRGLVAFQSQYGSLVARCLCRMGRFNEADAALALARERTTDDWLWLPVEGRLSASRGELAEAERLACQGVEGSEKTDLLTYQGDCWWDYAEVLLAAARTADAIDAMENSLARYELKRNVAMARQVSDRLRTLRGV